MMKAVFVLIFMAHVVNSQNTKLNDGDVATEDQSGVIKSGIPKATVEAATICENKEADEDCYIWSHFAFGSCDDAQMVTDCRKFCNKCSTGCEDVQPQHGFVKKPYSTLEGNTIEFGCDDGYELVGKDKAKCLHTGKWSEEVPKCKASVCEAVQQPQNGFVKNTYGTLEGNTIEFGCDDGYELVGNDKAICLHTGKWSEEVPKCKASVCEAVQQPQNGFVKKPSGTLEGNTIEFGCDDGYELVGHDKAICLHTGKWSEEVPKCINKATNCENKADSCEYWWWNGDGSCDDDWFETDCNKFCNKCQG